MARKGCTSTGNEMDFGVPDAAVEPVDLALLGAQLPPRRAAALRRPVLEHGHHPHAQGHAFRYLRELYLANNLAKRDHLTIAGESIDLDRIGLSLLCVVTAEDDHIAPKAVLPDRE